MTRKEKRSLRVARHRASLLSKGTGIAHKVRSDGQGFFYPIPCGTEHRTKNTPVDLRTKTINQKIISGRPKGKRTIRYTTIHLKKG